MRRTRAQTLDILNDNLRVLRQAEAAGLTQLAGNARSVVERMRAELAQAK